MAIGIIQTPIPPRKPKDWAQPQTIISTNPNPVINVPLGPKNR